MTEGFYLTGAQHDAVERMVSALLDGGGAVETFDAIQAARDYAELTERPGVPVTYALGRDGHQAKDEHVASMRRWMALDPEDAAPG